MIYLVWKTQSHKVSVASTRIRCLLPCLSLEHSGYKSIVIDGNEKIDVFDNVRVLIFVKTFSEHDYKLALSAYLHGVPVIIDLCDNIFMENYHSNQLVFFKKMAALSSLIVTTTEQLATLVSMHSPHAKVVVIPDQIETKANVFLLQDYLRIWRKRRWLLIKVSTKTYLKAISRPLFVKKLFKPILKFFFTETLKIYYFTQDFFARILSSSVNPISKKTIIWFGNHGAPYSSFGMSSLKAIQNDLELLNEKVPIRLLVVSNNLIKFRNLISNFNIETAYIDWDVLTIFDQIEKADLCVLPVLKDDFSICKSSNRALLSLSLGTPVVTSSTFSMMTLSQFVVLDDFYHGSIQYLTDDFKKKNDVLAAKQFIFGVYGPSVIRDLWTQQIEKLRTSMQSE